MWTAFAVGLFIGLFVGVTGAGIALCLCRAGATDYPEVDDDHG